nr:ATP-binding protein [uncultured Methanospirillum sp.]
MRSACYEVGLGGMNLTETIDPGLEVYEDPIIRKVFTTLIENAARHGEKITSISAFTRREEDSLLIVFEDDGAGVSEWEKNMIFEHGYGKHTGIGLFLAREILAITGLSIRENGTPGNGARFEIIVPVGKFRFS